MHSLSFIILTPLVAAGLGALIPRNFRFMFRLLTLVATLLSLLGAACMFLNFQTGSTAIQFEEYRAWVPSLGIGYHLGVDGLNVGLLLMGAVVAFAAACVSREIRDREKEYYLLLLLMTGGILGAFASLDLFFLYFFHELALVPTFIMIGVWGKGPNRGYAAYNITLYLSLGALIALVGLLALYVEAGASTFDIVELTQRLSADPLSSAAQNIIFPLLLVGFGILVSLWPFHTWAPPAYAAAPTATAMLHAGVLKKFGLYALIRVALPLLPMGAQSWVHILAFLCLGNIVYCGLVAMRQKDLNLLLGNSSVAHMGFAFLGIATLGLVGITGAVVVMVAHGLLAALSFALSGYLYRETGTSQIDQWGGLLRRLPFIGTALVMAMMASCGLPGFANFPGEALVIFGAWSGFTAVAVLAAWGALIIGAVYMLRGIRNILHGPILERWADLADAPNLWVKLPFALLLAVSLLFGCWPRLLTDKIQPSAALVVKAISGQPIGFGSSPAHDHTGKKGVRAQTSPAKP